MRKIYRNCMPGLGMALTAILSVSAQDTRTVIEPVLPPACATLLAERVGDGEKLP